MFPPGVVMVFDREYGCTEAEWLRSLPAAVAPHAWVPEPPSQALITVGDGRLHLGWTPLPSRRIALLNMPRLRVGFRFEAVPAPLRERFMRRFDLVLQRGGG